MPAEGFSVLTVKEEYVEQLRSIYRGMVEGSASPVLLDNDTYQLIQDGVKRGLGRSTEQVIRLAVLHRLRRPEVTVVQLDEHVLRTANKYLSTKEAREHNLHSVTDLVMEGLDEFLIERLTMSTEAIWNLGENIHMVGQPHFPESVETWVKLLGANLGKGASISIMEWREYKSPNRYNSYLGAKIGPDIFVVGGLSSGERFHEHAMQYLSKAKLLAEVRPENDTVLQRIKALHERFEEMTSHEQWHKIHTLGDLV